MKDIARKLHLSRTTVSNILNNNLDDKSYKEETIRAVLETAKEMNYIPNYNAKSLKTGITKTIAIVVPDIANDFYVHLIKMIENFSVADNYSLIVCITEETLSKENNILNILVSKRVDGVLIAPVSYEKSLLRTDYGYKIICFDRLVAGDRYPNVRIDNEKAAYDLTERILSESAEKPLFLAGSKYDYTVIQRLSGYTKCLFDNNITFDQKRVIYDIFDDKDSYNKMNITIQSSQVEFDSIFLSTNYFIYGVLESLTFNNIRSIPMGGFEDYRGSNLVEQRIYKVIQPEEEMARLAYDNLLKMLNHKDVDNIVLDTIIVP
ncbi:MAG: LacI family DNA-binding transcriptional regulator [Eubacteriales bacterium]|nr:LacI family DNA-binding transcriptional regulator [Eubacteriales bacterium]